MTTAPDDASGDGTPGALQATLRVEPAPEAGCALLAAGERGEDVVRSEVGDGCDGEGPRCRAAVSVTDDGEPRRELVDGRIREHCVCPAFHEVDCAADVRGFADGALTVAVSVPDREALRELVRELRTRDASVQLVRVLPLSVEEGDALRLDAGSITEKQREALETAVAMGYYDRPRGADLADLAGELGVSRSAVSQRLNAAEATLVRQLVDPADELVAEGRPLSTDASVGAGSSD